MNVLDELRTIVNKGGHYLKVLNEINNYLLSAGHANYSAFYFNRRDKDYLVASVGEWNMVDTIKVKLSKRDGSLLGYWLIDNLDIPISFLEDLAGLMSKSLFFDEWEHSYSFTQNRGCEYFPCHKIDDENKFSCLFCYCPLYLIPDCGGNFKLLKNGMKDCSDCLLPHKKESYDYVIAKLSAGLKG